MDITIGEVWTLKLNSGEELVARVNDIQGNQLLLHDPLSIAPGPQGVGLIPSLFTADPKGEVRLNLHSIAMYAPAESSIKAKYLEATTGIVVPEKKLILG
jgi:hypothetical protein